jgi:hypothetical protein
MPRKYRDALKPLFDYVARERALSDDVANPGGQHVGRTPSIAPSTLKTLEELIAPLKKMAGVSD